MVMSGGTLAGSNFTHIRAHTVIKSLHFCQWLHHTELLTLTIVLIIQLEASLPGHKMAAYR